MGLRRRAVGKEGPIWMDDYKRGNEDTLAQSDAKANLDWPSAIPGSTHRQNSKATIF